MVCFRPPPPPPAFLKKSPFPRPARGLSPPASASALASLCVCVGGGGRSRQGPAAWQGPFCKGSAPCLSAGGLTPPSGPVCGLQGWISGWPSPQQRALLLRVSPCPSTVTWLSGSQITSPACQG